MRLGYLVALTLCTTLLGCETPKPPPKATTLAPAGKPATSSPVGAAPLSEAQKRQFVDFIVSATSGQSQGDVVDSARLFEKVADLVEVPRAQRATFISSVKRGYDSNSLANTFRSETSRGGRLTFLHYARRDGHETAVFRLIRSDSALTYFEFIIPTTNAGGLPLAPDVYTYASASWFSQVSADITLQFKAAEDPSILNKLFRSAGLGSNDANKLKKIIDQGKARDWNGVLATYAELPQQMKQSKICLMFRFNAATSLQADHEIIAAIEDLRKYCPNDPAIDFISLDYYAIRQEYGKAMAALDNLDKAVGGDAYIEVLRGGLSLMANDADQALAAGKRAVEREATLDEGYILAAKASQAKGDFAMALEWLKKMQAMGKITPDQIAATPEFAPFVGSPQFQAWRDGR